MRKRIRKILVTGGAGFIGSAFVRLILSNSYRVGLNFPYSLVVVDKLTYAGDLVRLRQVKGKYKFYKADICNFAKIGAIFAKERPNIVVHFAAETHVDNSIYDPAVFLETNIKGTHVLLEMAIKHRLDRFIHISTDEVYGDTRKGDFSEISPIRPSSPYAASKAASDLLVQAYIKTYGLPATIVRPSNNYGCWQFPEKLIPVVIFSALKNKKIPIYAKGKNIREWIYVTDCAQAIIRIMNNGKLGEIYNIGSDVELKNIVIVKNILDIMNKSYRLITFTKDRPGHDFRYRVDSSKIAKELGWKPRTDFKFGLMKTIEWYRDNLSWVEKKFRIRRRRH